MPHVAHFRPWRWSITMAAAPSAGSATSTSGANSPTWSSRSATCPGTCLMKTSRMSWMNFAAPFFWRARGSRRRAARRRRAWRAAAAGTSRRSPRPCRGSARRCTRRPRGRGRRAHGRGGSAGRRAPRRAWRRTGIGSWRKGRGRAPPAHGGTPRSRVRPRPQGSGRTARASVRSPSPRTPPPRRARSAPPRRARRRRAPRSGGWQSRPTSSSSDAAEIVSPHSLHSITRMATSFAARDYPRWRSKL